MKKIIFSVLLLGSACVLFAQQPATRNGGNYRDQVMAKPALPVLITYVPGDVVKKAIDKYGSNLYALGTSKGPNGEEIYHVTLIDNGVSKKEWIGGDGNIVMQPFRNDANESVAGTGKAH